MSANPAGIFGVLSDSWQDSMNRKDYHDAIANGISAYLILRGKKEEHIAQGALNLIHVAIDALLQTDIQNANATPSCSFCGRSGSDVRLGAGPNAFICVECVATFSEALKAEAPT